MSRIITTDDGSQYQKASVAKSYGGIMAGSVAQTGMLLSSELLAARFMNKMKKLHQGVDTLEIKSALEKALTDSGAAANGTKIVDYAGVEAKSTVDFIGNKMEKLFAKKVKFSDLNPKKLWKKGIKFINDIIHNEIKLGNNAAYDPELNKVFINTQKLGLSGFHEAGHSLNATTSKFWRVIQKLRLPGMLAAAGISLIALYKRPKAKGEKPKNFIDRATDFIKNNAGKLTLFAFVPVVAEELKATARGNKMAKQIKTLSPEIVKKVAKTNRCGAMTYLLLAAGMALAAVSGSKVRDAITKPKQVA